MCAAVAKTFREIYRDRLEQLENNRVQISSVDDLKRFCPHLKQEQMEFLMQEASEKNSMYFFAAPAVLIKNSYHVLSLWNDEGRRYLDSGSHRRTRDSYADRQSHGSVFFDTLFSKEAIEYAEANWSKDLIVDDWESCGVVYVQDPTDLYEESPKTKAKIYWAIKREWNDLLNEHLNKLRGLWEESDRKGSFSDFVSAHSKEFGILWKESLAHFSLKRTEGEELKGGRGSYTDFYCSRCGEGLSTTACKVCNAVFKDDGFRCGSMGRLAETFVPPLKKLGLLDREKN